MVKIDKKCVECSEIKNTKKDRARQIYLCLLCSQLDKYKLVYKTDAKNIYFLLETELEEYDYYIINGRRGYPDMTLYQLNDIKDVFCSKYKINRMDDIAIYNKMNNLEQETIHKKLVRKQNAIAKKNKLMENRKAKLVASLTNYGLCLRNDSKLCSGYINGAIKDWSIDKIVHRMCEIKYLYDYCHMDECCDKAYKEQREELNAGYYPDCSVFDLAESIALKKYGDYPAKWPWINK